MKVDVDKCAETAAAQGVSAMPTFIFYRNRVKVDSCQGADPSGLESKIQNHYSSGESDGSEGPTNGYVRQPDNLYKHIFGMLVLFVIIFFWKDL